MRPKDRVEPTDPRNSFLQSSDFNVHGSLPYTFVPPSAQLGDEAFDGPCLAVSGCRLKPSHLEFGRPF